MGQCSSLPPPPPPPPLHDHAKLLLDLFDRSGTTAPETTARALVAALAAGPLSAALMRAGGVTDVERAVAVAELEADLLALMVAEEARAGGDGGDAAAAVAALATWLRLLDARLGESGALAQALPAPRRASLLALTTPPAAAVVEEAAARTPGPPE